MGFENNLLLVVAWYMKLKTSLTNGKISIATPSSALLPFWLKKISYLVDSKSPDVLGGYFLGLPLPLFGWPMSNSGCFVFLWLFRAGWLRNDFPQSHAKILPSCSCLDRRRLSIIINNN